MFPHERSLVKRLENEPFALIGINNDEPTAGLAANFKKAKIAWRNFIDGYPGAAPIAKRWQVTGWPTIYLIDAEGRIRDKYVGGPPAEILDPLIDALVQEARSAKSGAPK